MTAPVGTQEFAANLALGHLGQDEIADINEAGTAARNVRQFFPVARDELLRAKWWNFATARNQPPLDPTAALGDLENAYALPADCLRVRFIDDGDTESWEVVSGSALVGGVNVETQILLTNFTAPLVTYTRRVETVRLWDPIFLAGFGLQLAGYLCGKVGGDASDSDTWFARARAKIAEAATTDSKEKAKESRRPEPSFLSARRGVRNYPYR